MMTIYTANMRIVQYNILYAIEMWLLISCFPIVPQKGSPRDHTQDVRGKPKSMKSKIVRIVGQILGKGTQSLSDSGPIENNKVNSAMSTTGTVVEEQAEMDPRVTSASKCNVSTRSRLWGEINVLIRSVLVIFQPKYLYLV